MQSYALRSASLLLLFSLAVASTIVLARDISKEQRAASDARDVYNGAKSTDATLTQQIIEQEKRVASEQAHLKELQDKQMANKAALENAQIDLDAKVMTLEKVWNERNKH